MTTPTSMGNHGGTVMSCSPYAHPGFAEICTLRRTWSTLALGTYELAFIIKKSTCVLGGLCWPHALYCHILSGRVGLSAPCVPWYMLRSNTGLTTHSDLVFPRSCPLDQNLARVRTRGAGCSIRHAKNTSCMPNPPHFSLTRITPICIHGYERTPFCFDQNTHHLHHISASNPLEKVGFFFWGKVWCPFVRFQFFFGNHCALCREQPFGFVAKGWVFISEEIGGFS